MQTNLLAILLGLLFAGICWAAPAPVVHEIEPSEEVAEHTWIGKLVDMQCKERKVDEVCPVTARSERFGIVVDGGVILTLDKAGARIAREELRRRGLAGNVEVKAIGVREGRTLRVESLSARR